jgi:hypothetical protein
MFSTMRRGEGGGERRLHVVWTICKTGFDLRDVGSRLKVGGRAPTCWTHREDDDKVWSLGAACGEGGIRESSAGVAHVVGRRRARMGGGGGRHAAVVVVVVMWRWLQLRYMDKHAYVNDR